MHRGSRPISYQAIASSNLGQKTYLDNDKTGLRSGRCYFLDSLLEVFFCPTAALAVAETVGSGAQSDPWASAREYP